MSKNETLKKIIELTLESYVYKQKIIIICKT